MSVPVSLADLRDQVLRFSLGPYLVTVGSDRVPRTTSVSVRWQDDMLVGGLGTRTAANVRANGAVTLLWPALVAGEHALIVDGWGEVEEAADAGAIVLIRPRKAVLHVTRGHPLGSVSPAAPYTSTTTGSTMGRRLRRS